MGSVHGFFQFSFMMLFAMGCGFALAVTFVLGDAVLSDTIDSDEYYYKKNNVEIHEVIDIDISNNTLTIENDERASDVRADSKTLTDYSIGDEIKLMETDRGFHIVEKDASYENYSIVAKKIRDKTFEIVKGEVQYEVSMTSVINEKYNVGDEIELLMSNRFFFYNNEKLEVVSESSLMRPETID